jgi:hypothetical protein
MVLLRVWRVRNDGVGLVIIAVAAAVAVAVVVVVVAELLPCAQIFAVQRSPHAPMHAGHWASSRRGTLGTHPHRA